MSYEKNGWKYVSISGKPKERGFAYGYLCANDFKDIQRTLKFLMMEAYGKEWDFFIKEVSDKFNEESPQVSQYLLLVMLYYYVSDKTKFNKINDNLEKYNKFNDDFFKKYFTMKIDGKVTKNYTGKRLSSLLAQINQIN